MVSVRHSPWTPEKIANLQDSEEMLELSAKSMLEATSPNDDIWRKFALPLTPPSSPSRTYGDSSDEDVASITCEIAERLQDVCENLDSSFDVTNQNVLRTKLISDCMWSGARQCEISRFLSIAKNKKSYDDIEEDLYPTPCPSPPAVVTDCPSSGECVDPATVFPFPLNAEMSSSSISDTDEEIDVVTVDSKPLTIVTTAGSKRKHANVKVTSKVAPKQIVTPCSTLKRAKSSPAKFNTRHTERFHVSSRKVSIVDDLDPESRRATHNVLERKRRIDLKKSFEQLRDSVPHLEKQDKSPKVIVLKKAAMHIAELTREEEELAEKKRLLQKEKQDLTCKLNQLLQDQEVVF